MQTLKSRSQFLFELAVREKVPQKLPQSGRTDWNFVRKQLHFLTQDTRFAIFLLLKSRGVMTRLDIANEVRLDPKKLYIHLYSMLRLDILEVDGPGDEGTFKLRAEFLEGVKDLFGQVG